MRVYRVLPWLESARLGEAGHPLYVSPRQVAGRLDNPDHYRVLYLAEDPVAAVAEAFGSFELWTPAMLSGPPALPGSVQALATYECPDELSLLNLDDANALLEWGLRPSEVVTRDRAATRAWALRVYESRRFAGVRWWSYYNPDWGVMGIWDSARLDVVATERLEVDSGALGEARATLMRTWVR